MYFSQRVGVGILGGDEPRGLEVRFSTPRGVGGPPARPQSIAGRLELGLHLAREVAANGLQAGVRFLVSQAITLPADQIPRV